MMVGAKLICFVLSVFVVITLAEGENTGGKIRPGSNAVKAHTAEQIMDKINNKVQKAEEKAEKAAGTAMDVVKTYT
ncbi:hypothetical protein MTP99_017650 [Tenebrio molitor]|nr:hypothetical protein MTP99_017650 [Tenebrio molitor]